MATSLLKDNGSSTLRQQRRANANCPTTPKDSLVAGTLEFELPLQRPNESGEPAHPQGSARAKRKASSLPISTHNRVNATGSSRSMGSECHGFGEQKESR
jgi:hypothetical protein